MQFYKLVISVVEKRKFILASTHTHLVIVLPVTGNFGFVAGLKPKYSTSWKSEPSTAQTIDEKLILATLKSKLDELNVSTKSAETLESAITDEQEAKIPWG